MKLRKCFCGGNAVKYPFDNPEASPEEHRNVYCEKCGFGTDGYWNGNDAQRSWNYLIRDKENHCLKMEIDRLKERVNDLIDEAKIK